VNHLLVVPRLHVSTGEAQASAVVRLLEEWRVADKVSSMCFALKDDSDAKSDSVMSFAINQLFVNQPRDDYQKFLEVTLIILGGIPPRVVRFMAPGVTHHARWMAKALCSLKIWLFRGQFHLTD